MTQASNERRFSLTILVTLVTLAAATGAVLTFIVGAIVIHGGPFANRKATARCQCDGADSAAGDGAEEAGEASARPMEKNGEVRRAFLAALARDPRCDDTPANQPDAPTSPEFAAEDQEAFDMPSPEEIAEQEEAEVASLEGELNQEPVDPEWAPVTEQATARAIAATESMDLEDVTCGESLCRVQVTHRDFAQRDDDVEKLLGTMPPGGQARVYAPPDEPTTVMYFSRKGKELSVMTASAPWVPLPPLGSTDPAAPGEGEIPQPPEIAD